MASKAAFKQETLSGFLQTGSSPDKTPDLTEQFLQLIHPCLMLGIMLARIF